MPRYRFGYSPGGELIDVLQLPHPLPMGERQFTCVSCGNPLIARTKGQLREKHFAHKTAQRHCSYETYLHKAAKEAFKETFDQRRSEGLPFDVELAYRVRCVHSDIQPNQTCPDRLVHQWNDLTRAYDTAQLEYRDGEFIPDLLLTDSQGNAPKLYIEILVTHPVSAPKAASGTAILEVHVPDEVAIARIREARLSRFDLTQYNLALQPVADESHACWCPRPLPMLRQGTQQVFYAVGLAVYRNKQVRFTDGLVSNLETEWRREGGNVVFRQIANCADLPSSGPWEIQETWLREMYAVGISVRHCFLCLNAVLSRLPNRTNGYDVTLRCRLYHLPCIDSRANRCADYCPVVEQANPQGTLELE